MPFKVKPLPINIAQDSTDNGNTNAGCCPTPSDNQTSSGCRPDNRDGYSLLRQQLRDRLAVTA